MTWFLLFLLAMAILFRLWRDITKVLVKRSYDQGYAQGKSDHERVQLIPIPNKEMASYSQRVGRMMRESQKREREIKRLDEWWEKS